MGRRAGYPFFDLPPVSQQPPYPVQFPLGGFRGIEVVEKSQETGAAIE